MILGPNFKLLCTNKQNDIARRNCDIQFFLAIVTGSLNFGHYAKNYFLEVLLKGFFKN